MNSLIVTSNYDLKIVISDIIGWIDNISNDKSG